MVLMAGLLKAHQRSLAGAVQRCREGGAIELLRDNRGNIHALYRPQGGAEIRRCRVFPALKAEAAACISLARQQEFLKALGAANIVKLQHLFQ
jgi:hypothetical protein